MTTAPEIVRLQPADTAEIAAMTSAVFADQVAITRWLVPEDIAKRERFLRRQFALLIEAAFTSGGRVDGIRVNGRLEAAAVWSVHHGGPVTEPPDYDAQLRAITGHPYYYRFRALDDTFHKTTPEVPHHHLGLLAATTRGEGLGTLLLSGDVDAADPQGHGSLQFLHASSKRAARLYYRLGFQFDEPAQIPGSDGLVVYPMRRRSLGPGSRPSFGGAHVA
jgi:GNAT superfamily N-acetyltransferase